MEHWYIYYILCYIIAFTQVKQLNTSSHTWCDVLYSYCKCLSPTDKATHPTNRQEDWEYIIGFCDQINKELEGYVCEVLAKPISFLFFFENCSHLRQSCSSGISSCSPQIAVTLLVHKIHSPQEWEALQALTVRNAAHKCQHSFFFLNNWTDHSQKYFVYRY